MRKLVLLVVGTVVLAGTGCRGIARQMFAEPSVKLKNVQLTGVGLTGGSLDVVLSVYNPNNYQLDATRLTYKVFIDSVGLANGALDSRLTVQSNDSSEVRIPVTFTYAGLGAAGRQLMNSGMVNYRVTGDVTVATPIGNFTRPYSQTGRFSTLSGNRP